MVPLNEMTLRRAVLADAAVLAALAGELGYARTAEEIGATLSRFAARDDQAVWVAEHRGQVLGWLHASERLALESSLRVEVLGLVVTAAARGSGIGARLLLEAEAWARLRGVAEIELRSNIRREDAHRFYLRQGYLQSKTSYTFRKAL
ncbi:GNAT family N-acetyltransferase [Chitinimonas lacunae]|uniref:GNAT family N-acetyltransferase n=1 Tax=Chitinimonas lacunae TaxID=1963018 RepID=A0ABV8MRR0_9NEIS